MAGEQTRHGARAFSVSTLSDPINCTSGETNGALETTTRLYDGLDRLIEATDAMGRRTHFTFDLAGRQLREIRGYGSPEEANYATYTCAANHLMRG